MLTYDRLICGSWLFGPLHGLRNASRIRLAPDGLIADYNHPNERSWTCEDGVLRILRADGAVMWQSKHVHDRESRFRVTLISPEHPNLLFCLEQRVEDSLVVSFKSGHTSNLDINARGTSSNIKRPDAQSSLKIAIATVVKNEASDILAWIGWYFNLGVTTILFYDDASTDGTLELVSDASQVRDIRLHRVTPSHEPGRGRQMRCYLEARYEYEEEFDWIGFFDADEYLTFPKHQLLAQFLDRPKEVGAVAINWCNYGSGGHILKPHMPAFYAYNKHFTNDKIINRHVKSFVRPQYWSGEWKNPHYFDVAPYRYDDPSGRSVVWSDILGVTADNPDWVDAKLMHYQCRSMEHFIERIKRHPDIKRDVSLWAVYDQGEVEDNSPRLEYQNVVRIMRSFVNASITRVLCSFLNQYLLDPEKPLETLNLHEVQPFLRPALGPATSLEHALAPYSTREPSAEPRVSVDVYRLVTRDDAYLETAANFDPVEAFEKKISNHGQPIRVLRISSLPDKVFILAAPEGQEPILIDDDPRICDFLSYEALSYGGNSRLALRQPSTRMFLTRHPSSTGGQILASSTTVEKGETFLFTHVDHVTDHALDRRLALIWTFASGSFSLSEFLFQHCKADLDNLCLIFPVLVALADQQEQQQIMAMCGAAAQYIF